MLPSGWFKTNKIWRLSIKIKVKELRASKFGG
jgi:hypothetical protein